MGGERAVDDLRLREINETCKQVLTCMCSVFVLHAIPMEISACSEFEEQK